MAIRFRVGSAKAKAVAGPAVPEAGEVSIATIASGQMPLTPVSCRGRIHTIFGTQERFTLFASILTVCRSRGEASYGRLRKGCDCEVHMGKSQDCGQPYIRKKSSMYRGHGGAFG